MGDLSITVGTADLRAGLGSVLVHSGDDEDLPSLTRVRLIVDPVNLTVVATDRFTLGLAIVSVWEQVEPHIEVVDLLPGDVSQILRIFKAGKEASTDDAPMYQLRIDADAEFVTITDCSGFIDGRALKVPRLGTEEQFPDVMQMISNAHHAPPILLDDVDVDGDLINRFRIAGALYKSALRIESHAYGRALMLRAGESFVGLLMPQSVTEETEQRYKKWQVAWSARLPAPKYATAHQEAGE